VPEEQRLLEAVFGAVPGQMCRHDAELLPNSCSAASISSRILVTEDPETRAALIAGHLQRLKTELDRTRAAVASLRQLLRPDVEQLDVQLRTVPARTVAAVSGIVDMDEMLGWYDGLSGPNSSRRTREWMPSAPTSTSISARAPPAKRASTRPLRRPCR
jgi:hypothetical protein